MNRAGRGGLGLISSTIEESRLILKALQDGRRGSSQPIPFHVGTIAGRRIVFAISGIGKTNAAHATTLLYLHYAPSRIVNFGIGGAYPGSGLRIGDIGIAAEEIYGDEGVAGAGGIDSLEEIGIPFVRKGGKRYFNRFPLKEGLARETLKIAALAGASSDFRVRTGPFVTVSSCTGTSKKAALFRKNFGSVCENMEGAAIAHICLLYGIPLIEVRGISNIVEDRGRGKWDIDKASFNCQQVVLELIRKNCI